MLPQIGGEFQLLIMAPVVTFSLWLRNQSCKKARKIADISNYKLIYRYFVSGDVVLTESRWFCFNLSFALVCPNHLFALNKFALAIYSQCFSDNLVVFVILPVSVICDKLIKT